MSDFAINVFKLFNQRGYIVPSINVDYREKDTGLEWRMTCGGTRAYLVRFGNSLNGCWPEQAADSHFMIKRITSSLLIGGVGLFHAEAVGRLFFKDVEGHVTWDSHLDFTNPLREKCSEDVIEKVYDWCKALCQYDSLRRAIDDAHLALTYPHEAMVFVYRGLEWLKMSQKLAWEDLAIDMGVTVKQLREFKKIANNQSGARHATDSGSKMRAIAYNYGTWVCALLDAINSARARLDSAFRRMTPDQVSNAVLRAMPLVPYP